MENEKTTKVAETIGNLILNGYNVVQGIRCDIGKSIKYSEITLKKRYAYYDDNDCLQGFDEIITINVDNGDIEIEHKNVESYKRYPESN